jgi:hypothetical protein
MKIRRGSFIKNAVGAVFKVEQTGVPMVGVREWSPTTGNLGNLRYKRLTSDLEILESEPACKIIPSLGNDQIFGRSESGPGDWWVWEQWDNCILALEYNRQYAYDEIVALFPSPEALAYAVAAGYIAALGTVCPICSSPVRVGKAHEIVYLRTVDPATGRVGEIGARLPNGVTNAWVECSNEACPGYADGLKNFMADEFV